METSLSLALMFIGAILGAILNPLGQRFAESKFIKRKKEVGLTSALYFLLAANGLWVIGEVLSTTIIFAQEKVIDLRDNPFARGISFFVVVAIFLIAAFYVVAAFQHLSKKGSIKMSLLETQKGPIGLFILGNCFWIGGEIILAVFEALIILMASQVN